MAELLNQKVLNVSQFSSGRLDRWHCSCTLFPESGAIGDSDYDCEIMTYTYSRLFFFLFTPIFPYIFMKIPNYPYIFTLKYHLCVKIQNFFHRSLRYFLKINYRNWETICSLNIKPGLSKYIFSKGTQFLFLT